MVRGQLSESKAQKEELNWVTQADDEYKLIEGKEEQIEKLNRKMANLRALVGLLRRTIMMGARENVRHREIVVLGKLAQTTRNNEEEAKQLRKVIKSMRLYQRIISDSIPDVSILEFHVGRVRDIEQKLKDLREIVGSIRLKRDRIKDLNVQADLLEDQLEEKTGGRCPVCGKILEKRNEV